MKPKDQTEDEYMRSCVQIDDCALNEEYMRLPSDYAYWHERYVRAKQNQNTLKLERDRERAALTIHHREQLSMTTGKVTESMVTAAVDSDDRWMKAKAYEIAAEAEAERLRGVVHALSAKKDMLISLGAQARAELKVL